MKPQLGHGLRVEIVRGLGDDRARAESVLEEHGVMLPLPQRALWLRATGATGALLAVAYDGADRPVGAMGAGITASRAMPGHRLYRVERASPAPREEIDSALIGGVVDAARRDAMCLRLSIELFERDADRRASVARLLADGGFARSEERRSYERTLSLDLAPGAEALLAGLALKVRRNVREPAKRGLELRRVTDASFAARLDALLRETYARTGGTAPSFPWPAIIELSEREPTRSRICGLFDPAAPANETLLGFSWGVVHGDYVTYEAGGSTRRQDLGRTPLAYAPLWDLIAWATTTAATWFDFGGVTAGTKESADDPLGGISDFKRYFSQTLAEVGDEWTFEPRPVRASIARAVSALARKLGGGG